MLQIFASVNSSLPVDAFTIGPQHLISSTDLHASINFLHYCSLKIKDNQSNTHIQTTSLALLHVVENKSDICIPTWIGTALGWKKNQFPLKVNIQLNQINQKCIRCKKITLLGPFGYAGSDDLQRIIGSRQQFWTIISLNGYHFRIGDCIPANCTTTQIHYFVSDTIGEDEYAVTSSDSCFIITDSTYIETIPGYSPNHVQASIEIIKQSFNEQILISLSERINSEILLNTLIEKKHTIHPTGIVLHYPSESVSKSSIPTALGITLSQTCNTHCVFLIAPRDGARQLQIILDEHDQIASETIQLNQLQTESNKEQNLQQKQKSYFIFIENFDAFIEPAQYYTNIPYEQNETDIKTNQIIQNNPNNNEKEKMKENQQPQQSNQQQQLNKIQSSSQTHFSSIKKYLLPSHIQCESITSLLLNLFNHEYPFFVYVFAVARQFGEVSMTQFAQEQSSSFYTSSSSNNDDLINEDINQQTQTQRASFLLLRRGRFDRFVRLHNGDQNKSTNLSSSENSNLNSNHNSIPIFKGIAGYEKTIQKLQESAIWPVLYSDDLKWLGIGDSNVGNQCGIILHGPCGCGKTVLARSISDFLKCNIYIGSPASLLRAEFGGSEAAIRSLFVQAREQLPSVVIIEGLDILAPRRGGRNFGGSGNGNGNDSGNDAHTRLLCQLLTELDGVEVRDSDEQQYQQQLPIKQQSQLDKQEQEQKQANKQEQTSSKQHIGRKLIIIGTARDISAVDEALLRPGRFTSHIHVPYPNEADRCSIILSIMMEANIKVEQISDRTLIEDINEKQQEIQVFSQEQQNQQLQVLAEEAAKVSEGLSCAALKTAVREAIMLGLAKCPEIEFLQKDEKNVQLKSITIYAHDLINVLKQMRMIRISSKCRKQNNK